MSQTNPKDGPKEGQRIAKLLARAGIASRREIERMIEERRIAIDGVPLETAATIITSLRGVTVDGNPVAAAEPARLFRYHKPPGLLTAERDPKGRPTIYDKLPRDLPRVIPVGRLDLNTEGLLLLTTDGELKRQLELPATGVKRTYRARAYGSVSQAQLEDLIEGVEIEGVRYGSIDANLERRTGANTWIEMTLTEGKNREVRRVLEYLGLQVSRLIRTSYGPIPLANMPAGMVDEIRQHDLVAFRRELKLPAAARSDQPLDIKPRAQKARPIELAPAPAPARREPEGRRKVSAPASPRPPRTPTYAVEAPRPGRPERPGASDRRDERIERTSAPLTPADRARNARARAKAERTEQMETDRRMLAPKPKRNTGTARPSRPPAAPRASASPRTSAGPRTPTGPRGPAPKRPGGGNRSRKG
ncbi:pseudouridine synthase [Sphingomonas sp. 37zxx]|uniref:pseudouridine synthase n=1 Tax=Sphingomonas sp. 37zxx TaxID=1550073 RepID=UPI00068B4799|nr:pseudouridine synthase [Sphingomonas sp. 37zxx]